MAESRADEDAWKKGKFPLRGGQGAEHGQALQQNVHFISGNVPRRTRLGQVLWGTGKANKSPSQGTIQVHLNQETEQCSRTAEVSSEKWPERHKCLLQYSSGLVCPCLWHHLSELTERQGFRATGKCNTMSKFYVVVPCRVMQILQRRPNSIQMSRFCSLFCSGLEFLSLLYTPLQCIPGPPAL